MQEGETKQSKRPKHHKTMFIVGGVLIFILAVSASFFFWKYMSVKSNPGVVSQERTQRLKEKVSHLYATPSEEPTVAEIADKEKLKDQPFFAQAEKDDILFIFPDAKLALLYRESSNKLINVGPIDLSSDKTSTPKQ